MLTVEHSYGMFFGFDAMSYMILYFVYWTKRKIIICSTSLQRIMHLNMLHTLMHFIQTNLGTTKAARDYRNFTEHICKSGTEIAKLVALEIILNVAY